jgi:hypothetical protein
MKKQTTVEWLKDTLESFGNKHELQMSWDTLDEVLEQAKAMEKEQMDDVAGDFWNEGAYYVHSGKRHFESFEQYYQETYGKEETK